MPARAPAPFALFGAYAAAARRDLERSLHDALEEGRRTSEELREREMQLRNITDAIPALVAMNDREYRYRFASAGYQRWFGLDPRALIGRTVRDVFGDAAFEAMRPHIHRALDGEDVFVETRMPFDAKARDIEARLVPMRDEHAAITGWVTLISDVTERVRRENRDRIVGRATTLLTESLDVTATLERVARLAAESLADWCVFQIADGDDTARVVVHRDPRKRQQTLETEQRLATCRGDRYGTEAVLRSGAARHMESVDDPELVANGVVSHLAVPLRAFDRVIGALSLTSSDPSRRFDASDLAVAQELADRVALALTNARLYHEAQEGNRVKDEFLAMLGHELRNPLTPILTALELMRLRHGEVAAKERDIIKRQVTHVIALVDDLLDVSRITRGKIQLDRKPLELAAAVRRAVEIASPLLEEKRHHLRLRIEPGIVVSADERRLTQIISNLVTNAAKYTPAGGNVEIAASPDRGEAVIRVKDDGIGMAPDLVPRVFDTFVQGSDSRGGLGLGLAIVRSLVVLHGGSVAAQSEGPGRGSEFVVRLPLSRVGSTSDEAVVTSKRRFRILVVDDNRDAAVMLADALRLDGHETRIAFDGPSALTEAEALQPELAFLDIGLPVMSGYEVAERLRRARCPVRLVAVTGYGQPADRERSRAAGFHEHLVKPVPYAEIGRVVDDLSRDG